MEHVYITGKGKSMEEFVLYFFFVMFMLMMSAVFGDWAWYFFPYF